jgi:hypothetical protein
MSNAAIANITDFQSNKFRLQHIRSPGIPEKSGDNYLYISKFFGEWIQNRLACAPGLLKAPQSSSHLSAFNPYSFPYFLYC